MSTPLTPTTDLVAQTWLKSIAGIGNAGPALPADRSSWSETGFVQASVVGGDPDIYTGLRRPVLGLDFYWLKLNSDKPEWGRANALAETVRTATFSAPTYEVVLALPGKFAKARVLAAYFLTEPRRMNDANQDQGGLARYMANMQFVWTTAQ